jgi:hypothetical protein
LFASVLARVSQAYESGANPDPVDMNWTCVVYGGPMLIAVLWYAIDARKWFKGPKVSFLFQR